MKTKIIFTLLVLSAFCFSGCSKHDSKPKKQKCKITTITGWDTPFQITYNANGKVSTVTSTHYQTTYSYSGNTVTIYQTQLNGSFIWKKTIHLNAAGLPISIVYDADQSGTKWTKYDYEYDKGFVKKESITSYNNATPRVFIFTNDGKNITRMASNDGATVIFTYYTDKLQQSGDYISYCTLTNNNLIFLDPIKPLCLRNKNLLRTILPRGFNENIMDWNNITFNYSYDFDADGKITSMPLAAWGGSSPHLIQYQYECK